MTNDIFTIPVRYFVAGLGAPDNKTATPPTTARSTWI